MKPQKIHNFLLFHRQHEDRKESEGIIKEQLSEIYSTLSFVY